jgi:hypothetical protein
VAQFAQGSKGPLFPAKQRVGEMCKAGRDLASSQNIASIEERLFHAKQHDRAACP